MTEDHYLTRFTYTMDEAVLLAEAREELGYRPYLDPISQKEIEHWRIKYVEGGYAKIIENDLAIKINSINCKARFYSLAPGKGISFHKDRGTRCSLNFLLQGEGDPVAFPNFRCSYKYALLNVQEFHAVPSPTVHRYLYKVSVFDKSYDDVRAILRDRDFKL